MPVRIAPATYRDLVTVILSMRPDDWREIVCQYDTVTPYELAHRCTAGEAWLAYLDGEPVAGFGVQPIASGTLQIWAFGTEQMIRAVPSLSRFILLDRLPAWIDAGYHRVEARSIADHHVAHRWMESLGGIASPCPAFGKDGEDFVMFAWAPLDEVTAGERFRDAA